MKEQKQAKTSETKRNVQLSATNLGGGAKICRGAAGAGVREGGASTAAHWGGRSSTGRGFWDVGSLTQDAMPLEASPRGGPTEQELVQQLNLERGRGKEEETYCTLSHTDG